MSVKNKIVGLAVTAMSLCGIQGAHAQKAQDANKTKAQTVNVVNQSKEYWLNSTDGDRMLVTKNKQGGVDIKTTAGLGYSVSRTGKVSSLGDLECTPEDNIVGNTIAYALTGNTVHKDKGCKQRDGESALRDTGDGLKFFVTSHINKDGEKVRTVWFLGWAGYPDLHGPRGNETSWEDAKNLPSIEEENKDLTNMYTNVLRPTIDITKQTADEMAVISNQVEDQEFSQDFENLQAFSSQNQYE